MCHEHAFCVVSAYTVALWLRVRLGRVYRALVSKKGPIVSQKKIFNQKVSAVNFFCVGMCNRKTFTDINSKRHISLNFCASQHCLWTTLVRSGMRVRFSSPTQSKPPCCLHGPVQPNRRRTSSIFCILLGSICKAPIRCGNESIEIGEILLIYRCLHGRAPRYLSDYIQHVADSRRRRLRSSSSDVHSCPLSAIVRFL